MSRVFTSYDLATRNGDDPQVSATSTGTANVATITAPASATACFIACETNGCRVTFDGTTPDATNGLPIGAGQAPLFVPVGKTIKFVSQAAANSVVHVCWFE